MNKVDFIDKAIHAGLTTQEANEAFVRIRAEQKRLKEMDEKIRYAEEKKFYEKLQERLHAECGCDDFSAYSCCSRDGNGYKEFCFCYCHEALEGALPELFWACRMLRLDDDLYETGWDKVKNETDHRKS